MKNKLQEYYRTSSELQKLYKDSLLSRPLHFINHSCVYLSCKAEMICQYLQTVPRRMGIASKQFDLLRGYKDKYKGKRCFITCTGPSLTIEDLEKLNGEYVFGMNSISLIHDKTDWRPDFYGIQDRGVFQKIKDSVINTDNGIVFAPSFYKKMYGTPDDWTYFHISGAYNKYEMYRNKFIVKFSDNAYYTVYGGYSITYSIMQLAVYMGFEELYLIGADCTYLGKRQHFIEHGNSDKEFEARATERLYASYGEAKKFAEKHGIKIVNVTRGGCLELFPREALEDVLMRNEKNKES